MQLSRRELAILAGTAVTSFGRDSTVAGQQRAGDGRLTVSFTGTTTTSVKAGTRPLGLGAGGRDGLVHVPERVAPGTLINLQPDLQRAHLFDAGTGERLVA